MDTIDIQRVPGNFSPPEDWPKVSKIDITTGLFAEWDSFSLELGDLPSTGWKPSVGVGTLSIQANTPNLQVVEDTNGVKAVKFIRSRLGTPINISGETTFLVALRPSDTPPINGQRLFSGDANLFRGLYLENKGFTITVGANGTTSSSTMIGPRPIAGEGTVVTARYGATQADGKVMGNPISIKTTVPGTPNQVNFFTGSNASIPPAFLYDGLIYRYQMWNRLLSDEELDAAIYDNKVRYKI